MKPVQDAAPFEEVLSSPSCACVFLMLLFLWSKSGVGADLTENLPTKAAQVSFRRAVLLCS